MALFSVVIDHKSSIGSGVFSQVDAMEKQSERKKEREKEREREKRRKKKWVYVWGPRGFANYARLQHEHNSARYVTERA